MKKPPEGGFHIPSRIRRIDNVIGYFFAQNTYKLKRQSQHQ